MRLAAIFALLCVAAPAFATEVTLKHDTIPDSGGSIQVAIPAEFGPKEGIGEVFTPPAAYYPFRIVAVQFMVVNPKAQEGGADPAMRFGVYQGSAGSATPGTAYVEETHPGPDPIEGTTMAIQQHDFKNQPIVQSGPVFVSAHVSVHSAMGGVAFIADPNTAPANHSAVYADVGVGFRWYAATTLGVKQGWVLRLVIDTMKPVGNPDGGGNNGNPDGGGNVPAGTPVVEGVSPSALVENTGGKVRIFGRNFVAGNPGSQVKLDGAGGLVSLTGVLVEDDRTISVGVPEGLKIGVYDVIVQNPNGATGKLLMGFSITGTSGCSYSAGAGATLAAPLMLLCAAGILLRRRRRDPRV